MGNVNTQLLICALIILTGYIVKKRNIISEKEGEALAKLALNVTLPALILSTFSNVVFDSSLVLLPLIAIFYCSFMILITLFLFRKDLRANRGIYAMLAPCFNIGLFGYPFVEAIFGQPALQYLAMFDIGNFIFLFIVVYYIGYYFSAESRRVSWQDMLGQFLKSIPLMSYLIALLINIAGITYPAVISEMLKTVSKANMPLSLLLLGIFLNFSLEGGYWKKISLVMLLRYAAGLAVGIALFFFLPLGAPAVNVLIIALILPPPIVIISYAVVFKYDAVFAGSLLNISNVASYVLLLIIINILV